MSKQKGAGGEFAVLRSRWQRLQSDGEEEKVNIGSGEVGKGSIQPEYMGRQAVCYKSDKKEYIPVSPYAEKLQATNMTVHLAYLICLRPILRQRRMGRARSKIGKGEDEHQPRMAQTRVQADERRGKDMRGEKQGRGERREESEPEWMTQVAGKSCLSESAPLKTT